MSKYSVLLILIILGAIGSGVYLYNSTKPQAEPVYEDSNTIPLTEPTEQPQAPAIPRSDYAFDTENRNSLYIKDQTSADVTRFGLQIEGAFFEKSGFIILSDVKNDEPNNVLSEVLGIIDPGRYYENIVDTTAFKKGTYFGQLYEDDGDRIFDKTKDKILPLYSQTCKCYDEKFVVQFTVQ
ncbi:hypothetical protein IPM19_00140 [bacterium]|nr:MAG: hypothetical protein IPM19_00140 [bacterium]